MIFNILWIILGVESERLNFIQFFYERAYLHKKKSKNRNRRLQTYNVFQLTFRPMKMLQIKSIFSQLQSIFPKHAVSTVEKRSHPLCRNIYNKYIMRSIRWLDIYVILKMIDHWHPNFPHGVLLKFSVEI